MIYAHNTFRSEMGYMIIYFYLHLRMPSIDTARELAPPTSPACHIFGTLPNAKTITNANANTNANTNANINTHYYSIIV